MGSRGKEAWLRLHERSTETGAANVSGTHFQLSRPGAEEERKSLTSHGKVKAALKN